MKFTKYFLLLLLSAGCSSVVLQPADYSWPVESVMTVDQNGYVAEKRHSFSINVEPVFYDEFADSSKAIGQEIRVIRNLSGFYYLTGAGFKNVYMFKPVAGGMLLEDKIAVSDSLALASPVFNQRTPNIELLDGSNKYLLTSNGIVRPK